MAEEKPSPDGHERLGEAIAAYLKAQESGRPLDRKEFLARFADLEPELASFFSNHDEAERLSRPLRELARAGQGPWKDRSFGDYEILGEIGRGGMGVVYRARQKSLNRTVALKMIRAGRLAAEEDLKRFRTEAQAAAALSHPNIVPLYDFGEREGHPYFTMELVEGQTLDRHEGDSASDPDHAARLMAVVARAVHHAHQRRIIHRDLKPANILIDEAGQPHLTDFGLALWVGGGERLTDPQVLIGTLPYMAPEQLSDKVEPLTTSVDVWSLGVILYELLTGRVPFQGQTQVDTLEKIRGEAPLPPRSLNRAIPRDLEAICLRCLEKEPERRYGSVIGLARDLEHWLKREPIEARPVHRVVRAWSWCRRNPAGAGLALGFLVLLAAAALGTIVRAAEKRATDREKLQGLVHMARLASQGILSRLQDWGSRVEFVARSPELVGLLRDWQNSVRVRPSADPEELRGRREAKRLQVYLEGLSPGERVVNWQVMDSDGVMIARKPRSVLGVNFKGRDYFQGTLRHVAKPGTASVHVSSVYCSQVDGLDKFDVCAPVLEDGATLGIVAVSITTDPTLGVHHLQDELHQVVLVAPWDPSPPKTRHPRGDDPEFVILLHPAVSPAQEAVPFDPRSFPTQFPRNCAQELSMTENLPTWALSRRDYRDPFASRDPRFGGAWLAGFAPVGNTGFVVIVQQKEE